MAFASHNLPIDAAIQLKDAGLVAATAQTQVGGSNASVDLGTSRFQKASIVADVSACEVDTGNESYILFVEGSNSSTFASGVYVLGQRSMGHSSVTGNAVSTVPGRYVIYFDNVVAPASGEAVPLRYIRLRTFVAGTVATGINYQAWMTLDA